MSNLLEQFVTVILSGYLRHPDPEQCEGEGAQERTRDSSDFVLRMTRLLSLRGANATWQSILLTTLILFICLFTASPAKATWLDSNFSKRVKLTIDADKVNGDLANFPVFVDLNGMPASFFTTIKDNGADLRVTKTDGSTEVPFELVYLDTNNGAGELHFQANGTLSGTTNSDWYLYYGYNGASAYARDDTYGSENVWSQGYVAVYHMNEDPNGDVADTIKDSTSYANHGTPAGSMTSDDLVSCKVGRCLNFDGSDDYIDLGSPLITGNGYALTSISRKTGTGSYYWSIMGTYAGGGDVGRTLMGVRNSHDFEFTISGALITDVDFPNDVWQHSTLIHNGSNLSFYRNGLLTVTNTTSKAVTSATNSSISNSIFPFLGELDEIRISNSSPLAEWIWTEYQNQNSPDTFYTVGSEEENTVPVTNGLVAWWDASDLSTITSSSGIVSQWDDKSGQANHLTQASASYPAYTGIETQNSLNVLTSNAGVMDFDLSSSPTVQTMFFVMLHNGTTTNTGFMSAVRTNSQYFMHPHGNSNIINGTNKLNSSSMESILTKYIPSEELFLLSINATSTFTVNSLGSWASIRWAGDFAEVLAYDRALSVSETTLVEAYLADKWGISRSLSVESTYPLDNGNRMHLDEKLLKIDFSNDIDIQTGNVELRLASDDSLVESIDVTSGQVTGNGTSSISIALSSNLDPLTSYYVNIDANAFQDIFGQNYAGISDTSTWNFTTHNYTNMLENGLMAWWDASSSPSRGLDSNGQVETWQDLTATQALLEQENPSYRPFLNKQINSLDVLSSNGGSMAFSVVDEPVTDAKTIFLTMLYNGTNNNHSGYLNDIRNDGDRVYLADVHAHPNSKDGNNKLNFSTVGDLATVFRPNDELFVLSIESLSTFTLRTVASYFSSVRWAGDFAEVLAYDRALSLSETVQVETYLSDKWGISRTLTVDSFYPLDNGNRMHLDEKLLKIDFSNDVDIQSGNLELRLASDDSLVESIDLTGGQVTGNGTSSISITLSSNLDPLTSYYVNIDTNAFQDNFGQNYAGISDTSTWNFTTHSYTNMVENGLIAWWDASSSPSRGLDSNGQVETWQDLSLTQALLEQETPSYRPFVNKQINGLDVLSSNGGSMGFTVVDEPIPNAQTIFLVMQYNGTTNSNSGYLSGVRNDGDQPYLGDTHVSAAFKNGNNKLNFSNVDDLSAEERPDDELFILNLEPLSTFTISTIANYGNNRWKGDFAEVVAYDRALTELETAYVTTYLADKWGLSLDYSSLSPADGSSGFMPANDLSMTFPQAVDILNGNLSIFEANGDLFETIDVNSGQVTGNGTTTVTINPSADLAPLADYYVQIQGGAFTDSANGSTVFTGIYNNTDWNFTTGRAFDASGFSNSNKITILHSQVNGDVTNFPVYLDLGHMPNSFFSVVKADGSDIRVTNSAQDEEMPFELVSIDKSAKTGELWFRADSLSSTSNSDFYLWYGNGDVTAYSADHTYGSENVWSQGYVAVYHLEENGNTSAGGYQDSSSYGNDGTGVSMTSDSDVTGKLGKAQYFNLNAISVSDSSSLQLPSNLTVSAWADVDSGRGPLVTKGTGFVARAYNYRLGMNHTGSVLEMGVCSASTEYARNPAYVDVGEEGYFAIRADGINLDIFVQGEIYSSRAATSSYDVFSGSSARIGSMGGPYSLIGMIDEVHISNEARSADWIKTEFNNQNGAELFYLIDDRVPGTETSKPMFMMGGY